MYWPDKSTVPNLYLNKVTLNKRFRDWHYWVYNDYTRKHTPRPFVTQWLQDPERRFESHCVS